MPSTMVSGLFALVLMLLSVQSTAPPGTVESAEEWTARGFESLRRGEAQAAESDFRKAVELEPARGEGHFGLGMALRVQRQDESAQKELELASQLMPEVAAPHAALAEINGQHAAHCARPVIWQSLFRPRSFTHDLLIS